MRSKMRVLFLCLLLGFIHKGHAQLATGRLLVNVDANAPFTPEQFAQASSAELISIEIRNPFKAFSQDIYFNHPFVVISQPLPERLLNNVATDYGYRHLTFKTETLDKAVAKAQALLKTIPQKSSQIPVPSAEISRQVYDLMDRIDQVLTKNNITYWAGGGTLLGAVRHKGLIAWDEDLDLYIFDSDVPNLLAIESDLEAHGLKLHSYFKNTYKIYAQDAQPIPDPNNPGQFLPFGYPAADLFTVALHRRHEKDDVYVLKSRTYYWEWSEDRFTYEQLQNIQRMPFGPLMIPIPSNPELNLNLIFGTPDYPNLWEKYAIEPSWDHRREKVLLGKRGSAFVEIDDFAPAPWQQ